MKISTVRLELLSSDNQSTPTTPGSIFLQLEVTDEMSAAKSKIKSVKQNTERNAPDSKFKKVLEILTNIDEIVKAISSIAAVSFYTSCP